MLGLVVSAALLAVAIGPAGSLAGSSSTTAPNPADKVAVAGSTIEHMTSGHKTVKLFDVPMKTSSPTDLLLTISAECALWTEVLVSSNTDIAPSSSEAQGTVKIWLTFDGKVVPVSSDDNQERGKVVFCDRIHGMEISTKEQGNDDNDTIRNYLKTRSANSFEWLWLNSGNGVHQIAAWAQMDAQVNHGSGSAEAAVGKRTLVIEPVKLPVDATI